MKQPFWGWLKILKGEKTQNQKKLTLAKTQVFGKFSAFVFLTWQKSTQKWQISKYLECQNSLLENYDLFKIEWNAYNYET